MPPAAGGEDESPPPLPSRRRQRPTKPPKLPKRRTNDDDNEEEAPPLPTRRSQSPFEINLITPVREQKQAPPKPVSLKTKVESKLPVSNYSQDFNRTKSSRSNANDFKREEKTHYKSFHDIEQQIKTGQSQANTQKPKPTPPKKPAKIAIGENSNGNADSRNGPSLDDSINNTNSSIVSGLSSTTSHPESAKPTYPENSKNSRGTKGPGFVVMPFQKIPAPVVASQEVKEDALTHKQPPNPKPKPKIISKPSAPLKPAKPQTSTMGPGFVVVPFEKVQSSSNLLKDTIKKPPKPNSLSSVTTNNTVLKPIVTQKSQLAVSGQATQDTDNSEALNAFTRLKPTSARQVSKPISRAPENVSSDSVNSKASLTFNDQLSSILKSSTLPTFPTVEKPRVVQRSKTAPNSEPKPQIKHVNKTRSKGPKRRLPGKSTSKAPVPSTSTTSITTVKPNVVKKTPPPINKASKHQIG